jgi:hypothetical protein
MWRAVRGTRVLAGSSAAAAQVRGDRAAAPNTAASKSALIHRLPHPLTTFGPRLLHAWLPPRGSDRFVKDALTYIYQSISTRRGTS